MIHPKQNDLFIQSISSATTLVPLRSIFARKSRQKSSTLLQDLPLLTLEYLQLFSSILVFTIPLKGKTESSLPQIINYIAKLINPSFWISMENLDASEITALTFIIALLLCRYLLFGYIVYLSKHQKEGHFIVEKLWKIIFKIQSRFLYYFCTTYLINITLEINNDGAIHMRNINRAFKIISTLAIILEYAFSLYLNLRYCYVLPTKSFFSSKNNFLEVATLTQKFLLQIFMIALIENSDQYVWLFPILNIAFDLVRILSFFGTLPLYQVKALFFQSYFLMALLALNIACLATVIANKTSEEDAKNMILFVVIWLALSIFLINYAREYLRKILWGLISDPNIKSINLLIHRIMIIKTFSKSPLTKEIKTSWRNMALKSFLPNTKTVLGIDPQQSDLPQTSNSREAVNRLVKIYLESLFNKFPKNKFISLFIAHFYVKKFKLYGEAVRILSDLTKQGPIFDASLLLLEIQDLLKIKENYNNKGCVIDFGEYSASQALFTQLKVEILRQAKLQIRVSSEILKDTPDLAIMTQKAQEFSKCRSKVLKKIHNLFNAIPDYFIEPFLLCAGYFSSLNHSIIDYENFSKLYSQKMQKYKKFFAQETMVNENLYHDNTGFFIVSGHREDAGNVAFINSRSSRLFGWNPQSVIGTNISSQAPPCLRGAYSSYYKLLAERDSTLEYLSLDTVVEGFLYHSDGYVILTNFYMNIYPQLTHGLYIILIFQTVPTNKDFVHILENGDIDCVTRNFGKKFNLVPTYQDSSTKPLFHISKISRELEIMNEAFNIVAFPQKYLTPKTTLNMEKAQEICEMYTTTGCDLTFSLSNGQTYSYNCRVNSRVFGSSILKMLILEEHQKELRIGSNQSEICSKPDSPQTFEDDFKIMTEEMEEKQEGWIDFEPLTTQRLTINSPQLTTQRGLLSSEREPIETSGESPFKRLAQRRMSKKLATIVRTMYKEKKYKEQKQKNVKPDEDDEVQRKKSINHNSFSRAAQQKKISQLYQRALDAHFTPKPFYGLAIFFYLVLAIILIFRLVIKFELDSITADIKLKKDILTNAQLRNYSLILIQGIIRCYWDVNTGSFDPTALGVVAFFLLNFQQITLSSITYVSTANHDLMISTTHLDKSTQDFLFQKDVSIYQTYFDTSVQVSTKLNTFQATDMVIEKSLNLVNFNGALTPETSSESNFIFRNSLNDLVVKNEDISTLILNSLEIQRTSFETIITSCFVVVIFLVSLVILIFGISHWRELKNEEYNLTACCRLSHERVTKTLNKFLLLANMIENQTPLHITPFTPPQKQETEKHKAKKEHSKTPNSKGLHRKYVLSMFKILFLMVMVLALNISTLIFNLHFLRSFQQKQDQLYFANRIEARVSLAISTYRELLTTNNLAQVENEPAEDELAKLIEEMVTIKNTAFDYLVTDGSQLSLELANVLLGDPCQILGEPVYIQLCESSKSLGKKPGMIYLMNDLENSLREKLQDYQASNKTTESLRSIKEQDFGMISLVYIVINAEGELLSSILNKNFESDVNSTHGIRLFLFVLLIVTTGIVAIFSWVFVFRKMKQSIACFKNVLRVFPPDVILPSFILKLFLMKTSQGILETIRNDI